MELKWGHRSSHDGILCDHTSNEINVNDYMLEMLNYQEGINNDGSTRIFFFFF